MAKEITYTLSYPIVLTRLCANRCGYCRFPMAGRERLPSLSAVRRLLHEAMRRGATQVEMIAGEGIATHPDIVATVRYYGLDSYQSYLTRILQMVEATDRRSHLFSLLNIGPMSLAELRMMRPCLCAVRLMLESADPMLEFREAHLNSPLKSPQQRFEAVLRCGKAGVPLTTGVLVGIGETPSSRLRAFHMIGHAHEQYGHIQVFRIQKFHPLPGTPMESFTELDDGEFIEVVAQARRHFGSDIAIQVSADEHPNLIGRLLEAGVSDFGDISVRRSAAAPISLEELLRTMADETLARGLRLARRFPVLDRYCSPRWYPGGFPTRIPCARACLLELVR